VKVILIASVGGLAALGAASAARAQSTQPGAFFGYDLNAGIRVVTAPSYEGGHRYALFPGGSLAVTKPWQFDWYAAPDDAASLAFVNTRRFSFGLAASLRENRGNDAELQGMRNIGWALETGGFMNVWPTSWMRIHVEGLKGVTAENGVEVNTGIDFVRHPKDWNLAIGPRFSWADAKFNGTYFGVTPGEAAASPFIVNPYTAKAGPKYAGLEANAEYKWRPRWRLTFDVSYHRMLADDANSPIVRQLGSADQFEASAGVRFMLGSPAL
jgi:outer membrane protein